MCQNRPINHRHQQILATTAARKGRLKPNKLNATGRLQARLTRIQTYGRICSSPTLAPSLAAPPPAITSNLSAKTSLNHKQSLGKYLFKQQVIVQKDNLAKNLSSNTKQPQTICALTRLSTTIFLNCGRMIWNHKHPLRKIPSHHKQRQTACGLHVIHQVLVDVWPAALPRKLLLQIRRKLRVEHLPHTTSQQRPTSHKQRRIACALTSLVASNFPKSGCLAAMQWFVRWMNLSSRLEAVTE